MSDTKWTPCRHGMYTERVCEICAEVLPLERALAAKTAECESAHKTLADWQEHNDLAPHENCTCNYCAALVECEKLREDAEAIPQCASCGCVGEITFSMQEEQAPFDEGGHVKVVVPVQECNVCGYKFTDFRAENIRQDAIDAARKETP